MFAATPLFDRDVTLCAEEQVLIKVLADKRGGANGTSPLCFGNHKLDFQLSVAGRRLDDPLDPFAEPPPPINEAFTVAISWDIPDDVEPGTYRVVFYGTEKPQETGTATAFTTESPALEITP